MRGSIVVLVLAGCIRPAAQLSCGDQQFPSAQVSGCTGSAAAGASCTIGTAATPGHCGACGGDLVCIPARCGDGIIDTALNEQCDGDASVPQTHQQCVDVGYDLGLLGCTASCTFDASSCVRFGWQHILDVPVDALWADGQVSPPIQAYAVNRSATLHVTQGSVDIVAVPGTFSIVTGRGQAGGTGPLIVAAGEWQNGNAPVDDIFTLASDGPHPTMFPVGRNVAAIAVGSDGRIHAVSACPAPALLSAAYVYTWNGGWSSPIRVNCDPATTLALAVTSTGRLFVANASDPTTSAAPRGTLVEVAAGKPTNLHTFTDEIDGIAIRDTFGAETLYVAAPQGLLAEALFQMSLMSNTVTVFGTATAHSTFAFSRAALFAVSADDGSAVRWDGAAFDDLRAPGSLIADDGNGTLYAFAPGGPVYRYSGTTFGEIPPPVLDRHGFPDDHIVAAIDLPQGPLFAGERELFTFAGNGLPWQYSNADPFGDPIRALAGISEVSFAVSVYGTNQRSIYACSSISTACNTITPSTTPSIDGLWMASTGELFAVGHDNASSPVITTCPAGCTSASWSTPGSLPPLAGCSTNSVTGLDATHVLVGGACNGTAEIWSFASGAWTAQPFDGIAGPFLAAKTFASGEIFAIGDGGAAWRDTAGAWHVDPLVAGRSISGTPTDLWIAGGTSVQHFDGSAWSRMTTNPLGPMVVSVSPNGNRILMPGGAAGFVSLLREL